LKRSGDIILTNNEDKMNETNCESQEIKPKISKLPIVSFAFAIIATIVLFADNRFVFLLWPIFSITGFVSGLYYLIKVKKGHILERICAIIGTSLSGLWLCIIFYIIFLK
jgi:hypothetical protein